MNFKKIKQLSILAIASMAVFTACKDTEVKPEDKPQNSTELITTMKLLLTDSSSGLTKTFVFRDTDGDGGSGPSTFDTIQLEAGKAYTCKVLLLDESKSEIDTISNEVEEESNDHLFVYTVNSINVRFEITDKDKNNLPLGLMSKWRVGASGKGKIKVTLKHQPGVKDGSASPGETDAEVDFNCNIR